MSSSRPNGRQIIFIVYTMVRVIRHLWFGPGGFRKEIFIVAISMPSGGVCSNRHHRFITEGRHEHEQVSPPRSKRQRVHGFEQTRLVGIKVATKKILLLKGLFLGNLLFASAS